MIKKYSKQIDTQEPPLVEGIRWTNSAQPSLIEVQFGSTNPFEILAELRSRYWAIEVTDRPPLNYPVCGLLTRAEEAILWDAGLFPFNNSTIEYLTELPEKVSLREENDDRRLRDKLASMIADAIVEAEREKRKRRHR